MKGIILSIKVWWFWLFRIRLYKQSKLWSDKLQMLIDKGHLFVDINEYTANFGGLTIWVANIPYASFTSYGKEFGKYGKYLPNKKVGYQLYIIFQRSIRLQEQNELKEFEKTLTNLKP